MFSDLGLFSDLSFTFACLITWRPNTAEELSIHTTILGATKSMRIYIHDVGIKSRGASLTSRIYKVAILKVSGELCEKNVEFFNISAVTPLKIRR